MICPNCNKEMILETVEKTVHFRGHDLTIPVSHYRCEDCGLEAGTLEQTGATQNAIADAFRQKEGFLTGREIRSLREARKWTQMRLAEETGQGVASIKRWENGCVQTPAMDRLLREVLESSSPDRELGGGRLLSLPRARRVLDEFQKALRRKILQTGERGLYAAKYLWFADMGAFRELGISMTGAAYARLPQGPQMDNYRELAGLILEADPSLSDPLTEREKALILRVAKAFPTNREVYEASHREEIWQSLPDGSHIPYSSAHRLKGI